MRNLNNLVSLPAGDVLIIAYGINDGGSIAGAGTFNGQLDAFRLDPMPMFAGTPGRQTAGTGSGAHYGKRGTAEPSDALQPKCRLVAARNQRRARTGPTIWHGTQLDLGQECLSRHDADPIIQRACR